MHWIVEETRRWYIKAKDSATAIEAAENEEPDTTEWIVEEDPPEDRQDFVNPSQAV